MVPWLRQNENFLTSNLCIPGLVRIPNRTVMKALKPHCVLFSHWLSLRMKRAAISGAQRKYTYSSASSPPLCSEFLGSTMLASECVYTMCPDWSPGSRTPQTLSVAQADLREIPFLTCQHELGPYFYTAHAHCVTLGATAVSQQDRKDRK